MSIAGACFVFVMILLVYAVISEVFTVLFRLTGMPEKKARFQVVSLLTNSGYTTAESESIVGSDRRRALAQKTMLFGYVFSISIVSALVNLLFSLKLAEIEELLWSLPLPILAVGLWLYFKHNKDVRIWFSRQIDELAGRILAHAPDDQVLVIDSHGKSILAQVHLAELPGFLRDTSLKDSGLREEGVNVVFIKRKGTDAILAEGTTILRDGDVLVVFGHVDVIERVFGLKEGAAKHQIS